MLGSQANVSDANICLNTIVASTFEKFADELDGSKDIEKAVNSLISRELKAHYRIIFNLDGYGPDWEKEAEKRGLLNNKNTADAVPVLYEEKNIDVYVKQGVFTKAEAVARADIRLENYTKMINIEALTMIEMVKQDIIPAVSDFVAELCQNAASKQAISSKIPMNTELQLIDRLADLNDKTFAAVNKMESDLKGIKMGDIASSSQAMAHTIVPDMDAVRKLVDEMEKLTSSDFWPYPTYYDLLYSVR